MQGKAQKKEGSELESQNSKPKEFRSIQEHEEEKKESRVRVFFEKKTTTRSKSGRI